VLCSSARCQPIAGDPIHVQCASEARAGKLTSTFSLWDLTATRHKPAKTPVSCTGANANAWAFCLDASCVAEKGGMSCTCKLSPASDYTIFASACPSDDKALHVACSQIWSSASGAELMSGYSQLAPYYGNPPKLAYCPPVTPENATTKAKDSHRNDDR